MLDANAFDYLLDRRIDPARVRRAAELFITNVQHVELLDVPDPRRRKGLIGVLSAIDPVVRPASIDLLPDRLRDDPRHARWSPGADGSEGIPDDAPHADAPTHALRDAKDRAIAEAARLDGCVVVTDDAGFQRALAAVGMPVLSCPEAFDAFRT